MAGRSQLPWLDVKPLFAPENGVRLEGSQGTGSHGDRLTLGLRAHCRVNLMQAAVFKKSAIGSRQDIAAQSI